MDDYKIYSPLALINKRHKQVVRYAHKCARAGNQNLLNELFFISFFVKAQKEANEVDYNKWIHDFAGISFASGKKHQQQLTLYKHKEKRIAFLGLGNDPSAYEHIYHLCQHLNLSANFKPYLFIFAGEDNLEHLRDRFNTAGTPVIFVQFNESTIIPACIAMRDRLAHEEIDTAVWVHLPTLMFPLFGMRVAAKQIFLSQYLHPDLAHFAIDGLLTYGSINTKTSVFLNDPWRTISSALTIAPKQNDKSQTLRQTYADKNTRILATFGRIEKIRQNGFLTSVAAILAAVPNTLYLYTGYEDDADIAAFFASKGFEHRVQFIGWVDIDATIPIVDMVLDSFPLATGITALKCMAYKKPVLSLDSPYSYMGRDIKPIASHTNFSGFTAAEMVSRELADIFHTLPFQPYAKDADDYETKAITLLNDAVACSQLSEFQSRCVERLYTNTKLMGQVFIEHLGEI